MFRGFAAGSPNSIFLTPDFPGRVFFPPVKKRSWSLCVDGQNLKRWAMKEHNIFVPEVLLFLKAVRFSSLHIAKVQVDFFQFQWWHYALHIFFFDVGPFKM